MSDAGAGWLARAPGLMILAADGAGVGRPRPGDPITVLGEHDPPGLTAAVDHIMLPEA